MIPFASAFRVRRVLSFLVSSALLASILLLPHFAKAADLLPSALPTAVVNTYYEQQLTASNTLTLPIVWSVSSGSLPVGFSLSSSGDRSIFLKGTSTTIGATNFRVIATGANSSTDSLSYALVVVSHLDILAISLPTVNTGVAYNYTFNVSGDTSPYTWSIVNGILPMGLVFDSATGRITGTATAGVSSILSLRVTDASGAIARHDFPLTVVVSTTVDTAVVARLVNFTRIGVGVHALVKLPNDGNNFTQEDSAVYYLGEDGRRHAFPNPNVYFSWYEGFSSIQTMDAASLASIPLGKNVTYRPGVKLVKFLTDNNVYAVAGNSSLRWVKTESVAQDLYGNAWRSMVDDIQDTFYNDYNINLGDVIMSASDYSPTVMRSSFTNPSQGLFQ